MTIFNFLVYLMKNGLKYIAKDKMAYRKKLAFLATVNPSSLLPVSPALNYTLVF